MNHLEPSTGQPWPDGFHRIRHYGFLANGHRAAKLALCRRLLGAPVTDAPADEVEDEASRPASRFCPCCGDTMMLTGILPPLMPQRPQFWDDSS